MGLVRFGLRNVWVRFGLGQVTFALGWVWVRLGEVWVRLGKVRFGFG